MSATVGLDPGANVGIALVKDGKLDLAVTRKWKKIDDYHEITFYLQSWYDMHGAKKAIIEMPALGVWHRPGQTQAQMLKIARDVGQCQQVASDLGQLCQGIGYDVTMRPPIRHGTKRALKRPAWDKFFPDWKGRRISEHARDAAMLALWGGKK